MNKYPRELSGGMQQRVGIARAIALKPKILLLDEPFGRLDSLTRMNLQDVVLGILVEEKITTINITHDVDEAIYMSDRICMMTSGPAATVGKLLELPFSRPRHRKEVHGGSPLLQFARQPGFVPRSNKINRTTRRRARPCRIRMSISPPTFRMKKRLFLPEQCVWVDQTLVGNRHAF